MKTSSIDYAILELLEKNEGHLKAHEVYQILHPRFSAVNPSTVYRALDRLAKSGKISVSDMGTGASVYEKVGNGMHHHLVCQQCGNIQMIDHKLIGSLFSQIEKEFDFQIATNHLVLFGTCLQCRQKSESNKEDNKLDAG
jgi:Fur family transcriptional regulator, ferric uptake regulator